MNATWGRRCKRKELEYLSKMEVRDKWESFATIPNA